MSSIAVKNAEEISCNPQALLIKKTKKKPSMKRAFYELIES